MTKSAGTSFPSRLTKIDELTRGDHTHLLPEDECLFFGEYTARKGWAHSETNQLVLNFKIPAENRGSKRWSYKQRAIRTVSDQFSAAIGKRFENLTIVPVPPSKLRSDPEYDDRMMDMLRGLVAPPGLSVDYRELVIQTREMPAAHASTTRPPPEAWEEVYAVAESLADPTPNWIAIVDDLLVTGCRFRAMSNVLRRRFPSARITGLFIARRVPEAVDFSTFFVTLDD